MKKEKPTKESRKTEKILEGKLIHLHGKRWMIVDPHEYEYKRKKEINILLTGMVLGILGGLIANSFFKLLENLIILNETSIFWAVVLIVFTFSAFFIGKKLIRSWYK